MIMKIIEVDKLKPDPLSSALNSTDKETVTISGYICDVDEATISVSETRDGASYIVCPRSAIVIAFTEEKSDQVTLLVEANALVKEVFTRRAGVIGAQARAVGGTGCGTTCTSRDGEATCCCGVGQRCRSFLNTCVCEDASRPLSADLGSDASMPEADLMFQSRFPSTLPICGWRKVVCGSALPGYPVPMCWEYYCFYPGSSRNFSRD